jgi:protein Shroom
LRADQICLKEETKVNEGVGQQISVQVMQLAQPNECEKYKLHVEEMDKITSLIFGLSGRLAKAENAMLISKVANDEEGQKEKVIQSYFCIYILL